MTIDNTLALIIGVLISFIIIIIVIIGFSFNQIKFIFYEQLCAEECFPHQYDMMDIETCMCWLPNGKLEQRFINE